MSGIAAIIAATAGSTAAIAAAAAKKRKDEEEEKMSTYKSDDLDGWEFKIVRSNTGRFRNYDAVNLLCQEEAQAGWEMVEKFDDQRIRFKRRVDKRSMDAHLQTDPYRTSVGAGTNTSVMLVLGLAILLGGLALFFFLNG